jgi:glycine cleavage system H protein
MPKAGTIVEKGKTLGSVESVKAVSDVYAPVSGEVIEVNQELAGGPELLNQDPHGAAWLVKIRLSTPDEIEQLLTAGEYQEYLGAQD